MNNEISDNHLQKICYHRPKYQPRFTIFFTSHLIMGITQLRFHYQKLSFYITMHYNNVSTTQSHSLNPRMPIRWRRIKYLTHIELTKNNSALTKIKYSDQLVVLVQIMSMALQMKAHIVFFSLCNIPNIYA